MRSLFLVVALIGATLLTTDSRASADEPLAATAQASIDRPVVLREVAVISGNLVRVGDLFINAGEKAHRDVGYAPAPGRRTTFDARTLYRLARAHGLDWAPMSLRDKAVIERDSVVVSASEIENSILAALPDSGIDTDAIEVELNNPMLKLHLPVDATETIAVESLQYNGANGRFTAILGIPGDGLNVRRVRVAGRAHSMTEVPVLVHRMRRGDVITERDIEWLHLRSGRIPHDAVLDAASLVGLSAKRRLRAGVPVRMSEVQQPVLVAKGAHVTIVLETPNMVLTARGRALENGGRGETIQVTNSQSHTVVEGVVTGAGTVAVGAGAPGAVAIN